MVESVTERRWDVNKYENFQFNITLSYRKCSKYSAGQAAFHMNCSQIDSALAKTILAVSDGTLLFQVLINSVYSP